MNPKPAITFSVNTETLNRQGHLVPNRVTTTGDETVSEADNQKTTRSIAMLPGLLMANMPTGYKHGETFTVYGKQALYLKDLYCKGNADDLLTVVTTSWDDLG